MSVFLYLSHGAVRTLRSIRLYHNPPYYRYPAWKQMFTSSFKLFRLNDLNHFWSIIKEKKHAPKNQTKIID